MEKLLRHTGGFCMSLGTMILACSIFLVPKNVYAESKMRPICNIQLGYACPGYFLPPYGCVMGYEGVPCQDDPGMGNPPCTCASGKIPPYTGCDCQKSDQ